MTARPPLWLGPRGIAAGFAAALLAGVLSLAIGASAGALVAAAALLAAAALDAARTARPLQIRRIAPRGVFLGEAAAIAYELRNPNAAAVRYAIYEAPDARLGTPLAPLTGRLDAHATVTVSVTCLPRERGAGTLGLAFVTVASLAGLIVRRRAAGEPFAYLVRPDRAAYERGADLARRRLLDAGLRRARRRGLGAEFESVRSYVPGDAFRTIDWKASARRGALLVTQLEAERGGRLVLAIDAGRLMAARLDTRRKLDYAMSAAASIAATALAAGDRVGAYAFTTAPLAVIPAARGPRHVARVRDVLATVQPQLVESDYEAMALGLNAAFRGRALVVVFTDLFDPVASSAQLAALSLLAPRHDVFVALMNDAALDDALHAPLREPGDAYRAAVAVRLRDERRRAVAQLRARGIDVVDRPAADLHTAALDAYLAIRMRAPR